ncbi:MAG: GspH/FimT family pseudopilin [Armatimonadetes bacterium]|nr:GspH/FimT family pseudopilin [Armatimonadota bacterium]
MRISSTGRKKLHRQRPHRGTKGYLLLETLAVTAILAMICAIIVPVVVRSSKARILRAAAYELAQTLRQARESALIEGRPSQVVLDGNAGSFRVEWLDPEENGTRRFQKSHILPEGIRIQQVLRRETETASEGATAVPFTTGGLSQETWITLSDTGGDTYSVRVSPSGRVAVYEEE